MRKRILSLLVVFMLVFVTGCGKKSLKTEDFIKKLEVLNYSVYDQTSMIEKLELRHTNGFVAAYFDADKVKLNYAEMDSDKFAIDNYEDAVNELESKGNLSSSNVKKSRNYKKFTASDDKYYYVVVRLKRTCLYAYSKLENKSLVEELLKNIGY